LVISTVLQDFGLFPWKTVFENTCLPLLLKGPLTPELHEKARQILLRLRLDTHSNQYPNTLSGGQKQRVALARTMLMSPDLLLLDEPFSSLDALTREDLQEEIVSMYHQSPMSILIVTHSIEEAVFTGETILVMTEDGHLSTVFDNPGFGMPDARGQESFYTLCLAIRRHMSGISQESVDLKNSICNPETLETRGVGEIL
jgi:NitT/TauT family transport system ATP-binding protein